MDNIILNAVIALSGIGVTAAVVLYFVAQKFKTILENTLKV